MTRTQIQDMARLRLEEAEVLFTEGKFDGCVYLCGYVVELALKAAICKTLDVTEYPETRPAFKTHDFDDLSLLAGLKRSIEQFGGNLKRNWSLLTMWNSSMRYTPRNQYNQAVAQGWLDALRDQQDGIFTWLQTKW